MEGTRPNTIFGIACNRQLQSSDLIERTPDVTRSVFVVSPDLLWQDRIQKAVIVLSRVPNVGYMKEKIRTITRSFFAQKDFSDFGIIQVCKEMALL